MLKNLSLVLLMSSTLLTQVTYAMKDEESEDNNLFQIHPNKPPSSEKNDGEDFCKSGLSFLREGKLKEGIQSLKKAMKLGNVEARYKLALMYEEGINVKEKPQKALQLYRKLLELNHERAKNNYIQLNKKLIRLDRKKLMELIEKGHVDAMVDLADLYMSEEKVSEKKKEKAIKFYDTAIEKGNARAMNRLAKVYEEDYFDNTDYTDEPMVLYSNNKGSWEGVRSIFYKIKALMLYKQASDLGDEKARKNLNQLCEKLTPSFQKGSEKEFCINGSRINQQAGLLTTYLVQGKDIKECQFLEHFLEEPYVELSPFYVRGWMYENGYGVEPDIMKAFESYFDIIHCIGNFIPSDWSRIAKKAYEAVTKIEDPESRWVIANRGLIARYEPEETRKLFENIIQKVTNYDIKGRALSDLAYMYKKGIGTEKDIEAAKKLYKQASDLGNEEGRRMYEHLTNLPEELPSSEFNNETGYGDEYF